MFKKALQVASTFALLVAGYAAYTRAFELITRRLVPTRGPILTLTTVESRTKHRSVELSVRAFGRGHWTNDRDLQIRYYNADRGFWMYAREYERRDDGKQLVLRPFAVIWQDRDGSGLKTATSDSAVVDLDRPLGLLGKPGQGALRVVHGRLEGNVLLRDDKGTDAPADDLRITGLTYIDYDEVRLEIKGDDGDTVEIVDRDLRVTGKGIVIKLRPKDPAPAPVSIPAPGAAPGAVAGARPATVGFDGAQRAILKKDAHIVISDVGPQGILPGASRPAQRQGEKTPLQLRADGDGTENRPAMQLDFPRPRLPVLVGPPAPPDPTYAHFARNVEVVRGKPGIPPDTLTCDDLHLTLAAAERPPGARPRPVPPGAAADPQAQSQSAPEGNGPLTDLTLRRAFASGHNVQIASAAQGLKVRCNELIHKKLMPEAPDETYFRGDATTRLVVEQVDTADEGPDRGKVTSFTTIRTLDATIFDAGKGSNDSTIVARGPGELETRPGLDSPVERTARWEDQLVFQPEPVAAPQPGKTPTPTPTPTETRKRITLTGRPRFADAPSQTTLSARDALIVRLRPRANPSPAPTRTGTAPESDASAFEMDWLVAQTGVLLTAPGKTLTARDRLDAEFEPTPRPAAPAPAPAPAPGQPQPQPQPQPGPRPVEPEARAEASRVWARIRLLPSVPGATAAASPGGLGSAAGRAEVDKVYLRGGVTVHQDPAQGKTRGTDVTGEAVDLLNRGAGSTKFIIYHRDPAIETARRAGTVRPTGLESPKAGAGAPLARVETEDLSITGEVIGLDQATDFAWAEGRGSLTQMTTRGLLSDRRPPAQPQPAPATAPDRGSVRPAAYVPELDNRPRPAASANANAPAAPAAKVPLTITWTSGMKFHGDSTDLAGRPAARAEFYGEVRGNMEDASLACDDMMRVFLDRTLDLNRPRTPRPAAAAAAAGGAREPAADIAVIELLENVAVVNAKRDPNEPRTIVERQRIRGDYLVYEKATGKFRVPGKGEVDLWQLGAGTGLSRLGLPGGNPAPAPAPAPTARPGLPLPSPSPGVDPGRARVIRPTAGPPSSSPPRGGPSQGRAPAVVGRNTNAPAAALNRAIRPTTPPRPSYTVTQVRFSRDMLGRFGTGKEDDKQETRWADFFGDIEALHGPVADVETVLDPDAPPTRDRSFITAQVMRVIFEPDRSDPDAPPRYWMKAWENATATTADKTIQADTITFDSEKALFYAYGEDGRDVVVAQQAGFGQIASTMPGRAAWYNQKTGEAHIVEPGSFQFVDVKTGARPRPLPAPPDPKLMRPKRRDFRNPRVNIERKSFTGQ